MRSVWAENKVDQKAKQLAIFSLEVHISREAKEKKLVWFIFIAKTRVACVLSLFVGVWLFVGACVIWWCLCVLVVLCVVWRVYGVPCARRWRVSRWVESVVQRSQFQVSWDPIPIGSGHAYLRTQYEHCTILAHIPHFRTGEFFPRGSSLCLCLIKQSSSHLARHVLCSVVVVPLIDLFCKFQSHSKSDFFTFTPRRPLRRSTTRSDVWPIGLIERTYRLWAQRSHWNEQYRV